MNEACTSQLFSQFGEFLLTLCVWFRSGIVGKDYSVNEMYKDY